MITLPSVTGDIQFNNDYVGLDKKLISPRVDVVNGSELKLESYLNDLQDANMS